MISLPAYMTSIFVISALLSLIITVPCVRGEETEVQPLHRQKRHILQMCGLVAAHTNRGCLDYNNYGCYCGLGNTGGRHVDAVDGCCRVHDRCYGEVSCIWLYPQFVSYSLDQNGSNYRCTDSPFLAPCAYTTCRCDLEFAQCLGRAGYNHRFSNYDRRNCNRTIRRRRRSRRGGKKTWAALRRQQRKKRFGRRG